MSIYTPVGYYVSLWPANIIGLWTPTTGFLDGQYTPGQGSTWCRILCSKVYSSGTCETALKKVLSWLGLAAYFDVNVEQRRIKAITQDLESFLAEHKWYLMLATIPSLRFLTHVAYCVRPPIGLKFSYCPQKIPLSYTVHSARYFLLDLHTTLLYGRHAPTWRCPGDG